MRQKEYTNEQIRRAKLLFEVLFPIKAENPEAIFFTGYGKKSNTGVINTILNISYGKDFPKEL